MRARTLTAIAVGGLVAGAFDITYAVVFSWLRRAVPPARVLQSVASGLLGREAYGGGAATAALGLALHFGIALTFAAAFVLASRAWPALARRPGILGPLYGAGIYAVMNLVVVPLSRFPTPLRFPLPVLISGLLVHMFLIGLPIALAARWALARAALLTAR